MRSTDHVRVINWLHCADYAAAANSYAAPVVTQVTRPAPRPIPPVQQPAPSPVWPTRSVSLVYRGDDDDVSVDSSDDDGGAYVMI